MPSRAIGIKEVHSNWLKFVSQWEYQYVYSFKFYTWSGHGIAAKPSNLMRKAAHTVAWFDKYRKDL